MTAADANLRAAVEDLLSKWNGTAGAYVNHGSPLSMAWLAAARDLGAALAAHPASDEGGAVWNPNQGPHTRAVETGGNAYCVECSDAIQAWVSYPCRDWLSYTIAPVRVSPGSPVPHTHRERVPGCFRCDLTLDELGVTADAPASDEGEAVADYE